MHDLSALESNEADEIMEWEEESEEPELEDPEFEAQEDEAGELESAAELLAVGDETELDHFLGKLIRKAAKSLGRVVKAKTGNSLGGLLKGFARQALPMVATAIGGPVGGLAASGGLDVAMKAFGLELEGLSEEDQELEIARSFVRVANAASRRTLRQPPMRDHRAQARSALRWAIRRYAPGLLRRRDSRRRRGHGHPRGLMPSHFNQPPSGYGMQYGGMNPGGMQYGGMNPGGMNPGGMDPGGMHYGGMDYGGMNPGMNPPGGMQGEPLSPAPPLVSPAQCPACAPCPACPACGAPTPTPTGTAEAVQATANPPLKQEFEFEQAYEDELYEHEHECECEHEHEHNYEDEHQYQYEAPPARAEASGGGRWVRRGNRIILFGA